MIVAAFPDARSVQAAATRLQRAGLPVETRTPIALPGDKHGPSRIPRAVLAFALAAAIAGFAMQCYATMIGYPLLIGGRPNFFWTSFTVYAFECGVLAATATAFFGFLAGNRLPRYWEPSDECDRLREASRDGWFLITSGEDAHNLLAALDPASIERVPD